MRWLISLFLAIFLVGGSFAAHAQDVLDRVEPVRIEERKVEQVEDKPVLDPTPRVTADELARPTGQVQVGAIEITGLSELRNAYFSDIVQSFIGQTLSSVEIADLAEKIAARARKRFPLASARIAPQDIVAGIVRVELDEGTVDGVALNGFINSGVYSILQTLVTGHPVRGPELERAILAARDIDGVTIRDTKIVREDGRNILYVNGYYDRFRAQITVDNDTTKPIGPFESLAFIQTNGIFSHRDSVQAYLLAALPQPEELAFVRMQYSSRIGDGQTEISVAGSFSQSKPGSYLRPLEITGNSRWASVGISRSVVRTATASLWLDTSLSYRELEQERAGTRSRMDKLAVLRVRMLGSARLAGGTIQSGATLSKGLAILGATRPGDAMASRPDADGRFTTLQLFGQWSRQIAGPLTVRMAARTQIASRPLLVSEEIGLGGSRFARGYDYSERTGDDGAMGSLEISYDLKKEAGLLGGVKPYVFVDGGRVTNQRAGTGGGSLVSAGGGARFDVDSRTNAALEIAVPMSGNRYETDSKAPRVRFSLTRYF